MIREVRTHQLDKVLIQSPIAVKTSIIRENQIKHVQPYNVSRSLISIDQLNQELTPMSTDVREISYDIFSLNREVRTLRLDKDLIRSPIAVKTFH